MEYIFSYTSAALEYDEHVSSSSLEALLMIWGGKIDIFNSDIDSGYNPIMGIYSEVKTQLGVDIEYEKQAVFGEGKIVR